MEIKIKSYSTQSSLLSSILFFILGAILFTSADKLLNIVSIIIGTIFATAATISLIIYFIQSRNKNAKAGNLTFGIVALIFAIIFIFFSNIVEQAIRFIVGGWILLTGIIRLINVLSMQKKDHTFFQLLIVAGALIFIGIYTIVVELFGLDIIGIVMMVYAGIEIIGYILYSKDKSETKEGTTTLLVPETTTESDNKKENIVIKEVKEKGKLLKRPKKEK